MHSEIHARTPQKCARRYAHISHLSTRVTARVQGDFIELKESIVNLVESYQDKESSERREREKYNFLGYDPKMSHGMFTICSRSDSVKAADFEAQQQTGTGR